MLNIHSFPSHPLGHFIGKVEEFGANPGLILEPSRAQGCDWARRPPLPPSEGMLRLSSYTLLHLLNWGNKEVTRRQEFSSQSCRKPLREVDDCLGNTVSLKRVLWLMAF